MCKCNVRLRVIREEEQFIDVSLLTIQKCRSETFVLPPITAGIPRIGPLPQRAVRSMGLAPHRERSTHSGRLQLHGFFDPRRGTASVCGLRLGQQSPSPPRCRCHGRGVSCIKDFSSSAAAAPCYFHSGPRLQHGADLQWSIAYHAPRTRKQCRNEL